MLLHRVEPTGPWLDPLNTRCNVIRRDECLDKSQLMKLVCVGQVVIKESAMWQKIIKFIKSWTKVALKHLS